MKVALLEFMKTRKSATFEEIASQVYENNHTEDNTIVQMVSRANRALAEAGINCRFYTASACVYKESAPE